MKLKCSEVFDCIWYLKMYNFNEINEKAYIYNAL